MMFISFTEESNFFEKKKNKTGIVQSQLVTLENPLNF